MKFRGVCVKLFIIILFISRPMLSVDSPKTIDELRSNIARDKATQAFLGNLDAVLKKKPREIADAGMKYGILLGLQEVVSKAIAAGTFPLVQDAIKPVTNCVKYPFSLLHKWFELVAFGSRGLTWNDVAKLNNTLYELIQPLTAQSLGDFTKERRAELVAAKKDESALIDKAWQLKKRRIVQELDYIIRSVMKSVERYETTNGQNIARKAMGQVYGIFAVDQRDEIAQSLRYVAQYCQDIRGLLQDIEVGKQFDEHKDLIKFLLARGLRSFKAVATLINEEVASMPAGSHQPGYVKFQELNVQNNGLAGLDQLFADSNAGASAR